MATEVVNFLPSEIARLVLGYLSDEGYVNSYKCFIKECPHLNEYLTLKRRGQTYPLHVNGLTLCQTLQEYAHFKLADTQRRQMMGVAAMWSQLDAVVRTLKEHTACKQNPRVNGLTQSSRVRRLIQDKKRQRQSEKLQKKRDLCKRTSATTKYAAAARIDSEAEKEMEVTESDVSEGEEEPPEAGNCGVLTPPTDTETKGLSVRSRKIQEDYRRRGETDNRETEFILHSAPPSVSSHHKHSTFQRSSSISNLLNISSQRLQKLQSTAFSRTEQSSTKEADMETCPQNVIEGNPKDKNGAIQCSSGASRIECGVEGSSQSAKNQGGQAEGEEYAGGNNYDNTLCVQPNDCDDGPVNKSVENQISEPVICVRSKKGNIVNSVSRGVDEKQSNIQALINSQDVSSPKPSGLQDEKSNSEQVLQVVLSALPTIGNLQSSLQQTPVFSEEKVKGQGEMGHDVLPPTSSSSENSQESAESGPSIKTLGFPQAVSPAETEKGDRPPGTPVKQLDEASQMSLSRTPRRKRLPRQKHQRKGSATLNDSNKTEENSLLMENITLFLNEFLNNPSLHERLAENINRTLSIKTTEKRSRKKSGKIPKIQENPKPNKPEKYEESTIPEESESNYSQNMESQGLYTFLDDILNINETQMTETQIGGIIELTSKDPNFESLFNLFQEPHSASDTQKTDFSGIRLEMGKEASINNSSLPSFTDCPDPSNTTSEENLIMEILQSPQPVPSQSSSYPPEMLDQTAQSQTSDKATPSSDMDWSSGPPNNQSSSNPTARNIFESFPQFAGHPDSSVVKTLDLHEPPQHEQSDKTESKEVNGVELESLPAKSVPTNNSQQLTAGRDGVVSNEQQPGCQIVSSLSLAPTSGVSSNCVTMGRSSPGPVLSLINSVRSPSVQPDLNQVQSPLSSVNNVPCQSPQVKTINAKGQEGPPASSPHPYTKLTDKVSVSGDIPNNRISVVHSPVQKAIFTNQPLSPLQVCVPKPVPQSPRLSSPNSGPLTPCNVQENRASVGSPNVFVGKLSKMSVSSPVPINSVQGAESASDSVLPIAYEQRSSNSEVKSPIITSPLHVKEMETDQDRSSKNTQGTSSLPKCEKSQKKKGKSTSKKEKGKSSKVSSKSSEKQIDPDLVETFETSVTEDLGFPVISIKSVMKSPQEVSVSHKDKDTQKVKDAECQQMSYKSFIRGVTGEECSTPVTERAGPRASPHTSQSSANSNEMLSEMIGLVSSLEKSQHKNSSSEQSSADFDKGKRNNSNTRKGKKIDDEANSSSPSKKLQWSPDLKALLKLVTPEKKGKSKGKKSKKAIASAEKRRNPSRKARRSNEENIRKDEPETDVSPMSVQKNQSSSENMSKDILNTASDVSSKDVEMNTGALSMPSIHTFMSPVQAKSLENNSGPVIKEKKGNVSEEVGLTPKTVLTAVSALKDNGKNSRKSLSHPQNTGQGSIHSMAGTSARQSSNAENSQVLAEPLSRLETLKSVEINQAPSAVLEEKKEKVSSIVETDYNKILYSPNRDFLDSPPRYESPGIVVSRGHYQGNISTTCNAQFDSPCEPIVYSSQIVTPSVYVLNESTSQHNSIVVSDSHPNVYSSRVGYIQNSASYQEHTMNSGDQAVNYNTVYIDSNGIVQASSNSTGGNIVPVSATTPDATPTPVTDILSAAAAVIHSSPLQTVDSYQLNSTPETQSKDEQESVGQLIAYPVGRYYPEKKLHVRSLNFGPEAGTTEIRKPGYGRGHKKKIYDHIPSPVKPGGLVKKQAKGKAKSKGDIKGKVKTDNGSKEVASIQECASKVVVQKQDNLTNPASKMADEADDFIPDASGSVYILEGNTRKKIKLHKTPRSTKTVLPYFLPNRYEMSQGIIPLKPELCKKSENLTPSPSLPVPGQSLVLDGKCELDKDSDSEVDVDGDCDLPDLSPEAPRKETPKSKCLEMVQQVDLTTPVKSSLSGNAGLYNTTKYLAQPSSVQSISDSCESFLDRQLTSAPKSVTFIEGTDSKESNSPSVGSFPSRPTGSFSNNSNSLPDLHSPSPLINMSTPPKKRITASLKHGGGCYFFSSSSQEGKSQAKVESKESESPDSVSRVPRSPQTPKGKRTSNKPLRQSPRFFGSPSRRLHGMTTPTKSGIRETVSNNNKGVKRLREMNSGENSKAERKSKKARNGKKAVDLSKVDFEKFLDKIHKM